jgi:DNA-binding transcriptional MocR family regulator
LFDYVESLGRENMMIKAGSEVRHYVNKSTLKDQISSKIKELILTNRMPPGQSIVIDKLAEEFGVSHTPVREALAMLKITSRKPNMIWRLVTICSNHFGPMKRYFS